MNLISGNYYHIYNRSNNNEIVFPSPENHGYFLRKYVHYLAAYLDTIAFCLMPTHFHFLVYVKSELARLMSDRIGILLSSYTRALNNRFNRHGSLFQHHTKSRHVDDEGYLMTVVTYIHQNPKRSGLVKRLEDWPYSSYRDYLGTRSDSFLNKTLVSSYFDSIEDFKEFSNTSMLSVKKKYWV